MQVANVLHKHSVHCRKHPWRRQAKINDHWMRCGLCHIHIRNTSSGITVTFKVKGLTIVISLDIKVLTLSIRCIHTVIYVPLFMRTIMGMVLVRVEKCVFDDSNWKWPALISEGIVKTNLSDVEWSTYSRWIFLLNAQPKRNANKKRHHR